MLWAIHHNHLLIFKSFFNHIHPYRLATLSLMGRLEHMNNNDSLLVFPLSKCVIITKHSRQNVRGSRRPATKCQFFTIGNSVGTKIVPFD